MIPSTILVTGAGGDIALAIADILRRNRPHVRLIGTDIHDDHAGPSRFDICRRVPRATDPAYAAALATVARQAGAEIVLPTSEAELGSLLAPETWRTVTEAAPVLMPNRRAIEAGLDKVATQRLLAEAGLPGPWTVRCGDGMPPDLPCIVKPRSGQGSKSVDRITTQTEAAAACRERPDDIFQEMLLPADQEYTSALFRGGDGDLRHLTLHRVLKGGLSVSGTVVVKPEIDAMLDAVASALELRGAVNVQFRLTPKGPRIFEINPRFSSTVGARDAMGFQDVLWALADHAGEALPPMPDIAAGTRFFRVGQPVVLPPTRDNPN